MEETINNEPSIVNGIVFIENKRNHELHTLIDNIKLHFGTEEELIKQLKIVIKYNNSLKIMKDGLEEFQEVSKLMEAH